MKLQIEVNGNKQLIEAENITVNGLSLSQILSKVVKLENDFKKFDKKQKDRDKKLQDSWDKARGKNG